MKLDEIKKLMDLLEKSGLSEIRWAEGESQVVLKKWPPQPQVQTPPPPIPSSPASPAVPKEPESAPLAGKPDLHAVTCPMVGTFYASPSPTDPPCVKLGDRVTKGQVLCIVEAMKLMNEIEADASGIIREICVQNESPVEFGTVLFRIAKE